MLTTQDVLEKAHTIAATEFNSEVPSFIAGIEQDTWARMMVQAFEQELDRHARHEDFAMDREVAYDQALDRALQFIEESIYVFLADN